MQYKSSLQVIYPSIHQPNQCNSVTQGISIDYQNDSKQSRFLFLMIHLPGRLFDFNPVKINLQGDKQMLDLKITFPRLKAYSQRTITQNRTAKTAVESLNTLITGNSTHQNMRSLEEKLNSLKYQYVNKSPHYFKIKNKSVQSFPLAQQSIQTIEEYVGEQSRVLDKQMLLQLAKKRIQRLQKQQFKKKNATIDQQRFQLNYGNSFDELRQVKPLQSIRQTKYQNFRPMRIPLKHNIKYVLQHPDLRVKATIT